MKFPMPTLRMLALAILATLFSPLSGFAQQEWTWASGAKVKKQAGVYTGTVVPGARQQSATWTDSNGNLWLFGGIGCDSACTGYGQLNDLWEFTPSNSQWHWLGGDTTFLTNSEGDSGRPGVYGQLGAPASGNIPGSRSGSATWVDQNGNFWLFGGGGMDANDTLGALNDLWEYSPSLKEWTWWGGSTTVPGEEQGQPGNYGSRGWPGGRSETASWVDSSGNFWLFGGYGLDKNGVYGYENDLWEFNLGTKEWTFVGGSETVPGTSLGHAGTYGPVDTPGSGFTPGGRDFTAFWNDSAGNLWLFGGLGVDADGKVGYLNDLWMFNPTSKEWAWMGGAQTVDPRSGGALGNYGPKGIPGSAYFPSGRSELASWTDALGNFWLLGGEGLDSANRPGILNDLWEYNVAAREWTFMDGNSALPNRTPNAYAGEYGMLGVASSSNLPGSRFGASAWSDTKGNLWLFGGGGFDSADNEGYLNDLWKWGSVDKMAASGGGIQSAIVGTAFATDLQATITHNGAPVSGVTVTFTAPASGASGTFAGGVNTAVTNGSGIATAPAFTANGTVGSYEVVATAPGANASAFALSNTYFTTPLSVTPNYGFGMAQQFSFLTQSNGSGSIAVVWMSINAQNTAASSCNLVYAASGNTLSLRNDAGTGWGAGGHPGASGTLSNSQCSVSLASTTVTHSGNQLTVAPAIAFTSAYAGAKRIYLSVQDSQGHNSGPVQVGTWSVGLATESAPSAVSVTPSSGSGLTQQFSFVASSPVGAANLAAVYMFIGPTHSADGASSCYMKYVPGTNMFYLAANDGGSDFGAGGHPGAATTLSNSQCSVNLATTTAVASGTRLTVSPAVTFSGSFTGSMIVDLSALDAVGASSGLVQVGSWTP